MNIKTTLRHAGALLLLGVASAPVASQAGSPTNCDQIAKDVKESVTKDSSKVLMIVEDALVINESCACEIIKSAIQASSADTALAKQIVQTAIAVAPKMTSIIVECAEASSPGSGVGAPTGVKSEKSGTSLGGPVDVAEPKDKSSYSGSGRAEIRGVYLMQPAVGGFYSTPTSTSDKEPHTTVKTKVVYVDKPRIVHPRPVSPSCGCIN